MRHRPPPPVLASARVLAYAFAEAGTYTGRHVVFAAGRELGPVPCLAMGRRLPRGEVLLLFCDKDWDVLAAEAHTSIDAAKYAAGEAYAGLDAKWQETSFTDAEVDAFLDEEDRGLICSFCGRHPHEVDRIVTGHGGAAICEICIRALLQRVRAEE